MRFYISGMLPNLFALRYSLSAAAKHTVQSPPMTRTSSYSNYTVVITVQYKDESRREMRCSQVSTVGLSDGCRSPVLRQHPKRPQRSQTPPPPSASPDKRLSRQAIAQDPSPRRRISTSISTPIRRYALLAPALALTEVVEGVSSSLPVPSFGLSQVRMCPVKIIVISEMLHLYRHESVQQHQSGCSCGKLTPQKIRPYRPAVLNRLSRKNLHSPLLHEVMMQSSSKPNQHSGCSSTLLAYARRSC